MSGSTEYQQRGPDNVPLNKNYINAFADTCPIPTVNLHMNINYRVQAAHILDTLKKYSFYHGAVYLVANHSSLNREKNMINFMLFDFDDLADYISNMTKNSATKVTLENVADIIAASFIKSDELTAYAKDKLIEPVNIYVPRMTVDSSIILDVKKGDDTYYCLYSELESRLGISYILCKLKEAMIKNS